MMIKGLEALERLKNTLLSEGYWQDILQDVSIIEKELKEKDELQKILDHERELNNYLINHELKTLEIIKKLGIKLVIPDNDYSKEHITIEIYRQHFTKEEWEMLKKELDL